MRKAVRDLNGFPLSVPAHEFSRYPVSVFVSHVGEVQCKIADIVSDCFFVYVFNVICRSKSKLVSLPCTSLMPSQ